MKSDPNAMYDKRCEYEISHFAENRCPECSAAFDPMNDRTFVKGVNKLTKTQRIMDRFWLVAAYAVASPVFAFFIIGGLWALLHPA